MIKNITIYYIFLINLEPVYEVIIAKKQYQDFSEINQITLKYATGQNTLKIVHFWLFLQKVGLFRLFLSHSIKAEL